MFVLFYYFVKKLGITVSGKVPNSAVVFTILITRFLVNKIAIEELSWRQGSNH